LSCETQNVDVTFNDTTAQSLAFDDATALSLAFDDVVNQNIQCSKFEAPVVFDYFELVQDTLGAGNIVAHFRLDETSGTTAADATGNGNDGTFESGVTLGATSLIASGGGTAVDLDGVDDYIDLGAKSSTNFIHETGVFAVGGWIDFTDAGDNQVVFSTSGLVAGTGVVVLLQQVFGTSRGVVVFRGGANTLVRSGAATPADGVRHIFITGDGSDIFLYADAVLLGSDAITTVAGASTLTPRIGDASGSRFDGRVDEWTIADVHATAADVLDLYKFGIG